MSFDEQNEKSLSLVDTFFASHNWSVLFQLAAKGHRQPFWISGLGFGSPFQHVVVGGKSR